MKNFLILTNQVKDPGYQLSKRIQIHIEQRGGSAQIRTDFTKEVQQLVNLPQDTQCVIVLGGDGTMLHAARLIVDYNIPIVGVNLGTLGFLTEIEIDSLNSGIESLLRDEYHLEERLMLCGSVVADEKERDYFLALNDVAITRSGFSRIISLKIVVNGELLDVYEADGVVISTPTGSTGYNLSAGGPVVNPQANVILVTPICPHSLQAKSIVLTQDDEIEIHIEKIRKTQLEEALATADGQVSNRLGPGDVIKIRKSKKRAKIIKINENNFYHTLRVKVGGKE